ncbi:MAG: 50S ribosomal protein L11 methyltransferase [Bacteroidales bacterium]|nr:50S ribosomal protein L11 methyltransferase [Candidatus Cacconaster merdequi]
MNYIAVHFKISPYSEMAAEIVEAEISDLGFDSFTMDDSTLNAFIPQDLFHEPDLKTVLGGLYNADFKVSYSTELIAQQNWNAQWESDFEPVVVNGMVTVKAVYHKDLPRTKYNIVIDPKMSFGSGHHQTTCMMIESLLEEGRELKGKAVLDMGCGTGILSIVAAKLGAGVPVHAVDIDPVCVSSANGNARRNRVSHKIVNRCGDAAILQKGSYDYILANINRNILLADMATYARALKPYGGSIFISGFFTEDIPMLEEAAASLGMRKVAVKQRDEWALVKLRK